MIYVVLKKNFDKNGSVSIVTYREEKDDAEKVRDAFMSERVLGKDFCVYEVVKVARL